MNLTEAHRRSQLRIGAETASLVVSSWRLLDPSDDTSVRRWLALIVPVVGTQRLKSERLAATYYQAVRVFDTGEAGTPVVASEAFEEQVRTSLLVTGPVAYRAALGRQFTSREALEGAQRTSARAGMRHALNGGRETLLANVKADERAVGWRRVSSVTACKYCSARAGTVVRADSADFHSHDGCGCSAEPIFAAA